MAIHAHRQSGSRASMKLLLIACCLLTITIGCGGGSKRPAPTAKLAPRYPTLPPKVVPEFMKDSIFERCDLSNAQPFPVSCYALVANLRGTGDTYSGNAIRESIRKEMTNHLIGSSLMPEYERKGPEDLLKDPRFAIVRVDALIPPGARKNQRFDVQISTLPGNNTSSLSHGTLYRSDLKVDGANPIQPGYKMDIWGTAEGPIFVNPAYAMIDRPTEPQARLSLTRGTVLNGGVIMQDRSIVLMLRQPELRLSRGIELRINQAFQTSTIASAKDEGVVALLVPERYKGDWEHFTKVVTHLYLNSSADFTIAKARQLVEEAEKPDAFLEEISYCWEGLGPTIVSIIAPLMSSDKPEIAYAASRAAAFLGDSTAQSALMNMARSSSNPFQIPAVQTLAKLPPSPLINQMLRSLLESEQSLVRIEAYRALASSNDSSIISRQIGQKFILDIIPSLGPPLIYAASTGTPRIAVFGSQPRMELPVVFTTMENRLTISSHQERALLNVYYRGSELPKPISVISSPNVDELIGRLGGEGAPGDSRMQFNYCDVASILQSLSDQKKLWASSNGKRMQVAFKLEDPPVVEQMIEEAPPIPEQQPAAAPTGAAAQPLGLAK